MDDSKGGTQQIRERLDFVDFDDAQRAALSDMLPLTRPVLRDALDKFYAKAAANAPAGKFFSSEARVARAKRMQARHWDAIAAARFDEKYLAAVTAVGRMHARLGLEPRWQIGAYVFILEELFGAVIGDELRGCLPGSKAEGLARKIAAITKAAMIDMDCSISIHFDTLAAQRARSEAARQRLQQEQGEARHALEQALGALADGDLTASLTEELAPQFSSLKSGFNIAVDRLRGTVRLVRAAAERLSGGISEISRATEDIEARTEQQAAALDETAAALEEIITFAGHASKRIRQVQAIANASSADARRSMSVADDAASAMAAIEFSSRQVAGIIAVVDGLSFHTNLLALNAGREVGRDGGAGEGFATVAREMRELARRSARAAKAIETLVEHSSQVVSRGAELVCDAGAAFHAIGSKVRDIDAKLNGIARLSQQQANGVVEISATVSDLDAMTRRNAVVIQETGASAAVLSSLSDELCALVGCFILSRSQSDQPSPADDANIVRFRTLRKL